MSGGRLAAALAASAIAAGCVFLLPPAIGRTVPDKAPAGPPELAIVYDSPAEGVPVYVQDDERWGGLPYAGADLATSGCGLSCAAMAWSYLSGEAWTPVQMLNAVGNSCVDDGVNNVQKLADWMVGMDPSLDRTVTYESVERAVGDLGRGRLVFGAMTGRLVDGGREYGGHVVLLTGIEDGAVTINDPCDGRPVTLGEDELGSVAWSYFVSIGRE